MSKSQAKWQYSLGYEIRIMWEEKQTSWLVHIRHFLLSSCYDLLLVITSALGMFWKAPRAPVSAGPPDLHLLLLRPTGAEPCFLVRGCTEPSAANFGNDQLGKMLSILSAQRLCMHTMLLFAEPSTNVILVQLVLRRLKKINHYYVCHNK